MNPKEIFGNGGSSRSIAIGKRLLKAGLVLLLVPALPFPAFGFSLLAHEEVVDIVWQQELQPLLLKRFPGASPAQLHRAHAYAYGGSLIQDIGYYPFGNKQFSDLTHYVRSGDFVSNLILESADIDQYAFALGALAHYVSDKLGHPPINEAVALTFPDLRARYGDHVTYEQSPKAHIQTEFGFDITQVAKHRYTSDTYHDFIGFEVSKPVLERAFSKTYGVPLESVLGHVDLAIGTFRHAVSQVIPQMTRAALVAYHPERVTERSNSNQRLFLYNLSRAQYEKEWGKEYRKPSLLARVSGLIVRMVPKLGVLRALAFKLPTPQTEDLYAKGMNQTITEYRRLLCELQDGKLHLQNVNCDTGREIRPGDYTLEDNAYAQVLESLVLHSGTDPDADLRRNILQFCAHLQMPERTRKERKAARRTADELMALRAGLTSPTAAAIRHRLLAPPMVLMSPKAKDA